MIIGVIIMASYKRENDYIRLLSERDHTVQELAAKLFISEPTVRRDIIDLKEKDLLICKRGLVTLKTNSPDKRIPRFIRDLEHNEEKKEIAIKAASLIKDGDILFLDQSSTSLYLANEIANRRGLTVITNNTEIMICLANSKLKVISCGGYLSTDNRNCLIGDDARQTFENFYADIAFFSTKSISTDGIISDCSREEVAIRNTMLKQASKKVFLCDSTKFNTLSPCRQCTLEDVDCFISEGNASEQFASLCKDTIFM